ncbi:hypothetical protein [Cupriavidus sp. TMH.W2]|uniref:hypothetical protein n=1 Tax=Cupriavidus sp. TMH.W2 TaxID=3434465 RepID=UPI003D784A40
MRVIIHSAAQGTLLYHAFDQALFSSMIGAFDDAMTFADEAEALAFIEAIKDSTSNFGCVPTDLSFPVVATSALRASIQECVAAGVPAWEPSASEPFKFSFHKGDVGQTLIFGAVSAGKSAFNPCLLADKRD